MLHEPRPHSLQLLPSIPISSMHPDYFLSRAFTAESVEHDGQFPVSFLLGTIATSRQQAHVKAWIPRQFSRQCIDLNFSTPKSASA